MNLSEDSSNNESNKAESSIIKHAKRQWISKEHKLHLKGFADIQYDKYELKELGLLRPILKTQFLEEAVRCNAEVTHRLRNPEELANLRTTDLIGIASIATKHLQELEAVSEQQKPIDWDKFNVESFNQISPKLGTNTPNTPNT